MTLRCSPSDRFRGARRLAKFLLGLPVLAGASACGNGNDPSQSGAAGSGNEAGAPSSASPDDFSFFVTSLSAMIELSGNPEGFGGDLSYDGKPGVLGADAICAAIAERALAGAGSMQWRAFLSTSTEHAIDRIGEGPWFDRQGRLVASDKAALLHERPTGADPAIADDLPNEDGIPNHLADDPTCEAQHSCPDNHDVLTGSNTQGELDPQSSTCDDWTSLTARGQPRIGHSWPAQSGRHWIMAHPAGGCGRSVKVAMAGGPQPGDLTVGAGGGYGGFYCFGSLR
jgi:hypothetical protein